MSSLDFTLSLIDRMTRPLKQVQASVGGFAEKSQAAFSKIGIGAAALFGVGASIHGALGPALEMYDALQEASARGIGDDVLARVSKDATQFSMQYGKSAVEFVESTAEINSAVAGLTNGELPKVTMVANTMAAALKSTAGEASEFMGQMFTQFSGYASQVGKVQFAEELAGKMAYMKKQFGTDMATIKDLMEGARGVGSNFGVGMDEQLAVLGQLQRSLGTEASGSYEGFLSGAAAGAKKLGLNFEDASGKMLSMPAMLQRLHEKYGASIEGNLKAQADLDGAFGDSAAVIKQLYGNVDVLNRNIIELGGNDGLKRAQEMAAKMAKPWDRLMAVFAAIRQVIGLTLLPVILPLINKLADMGAVFARWMQIFPNIARVVGYAMLAVLSFAAAGAMANIVMGVSSFVILGLKALWSGLTAVMKIGTAAMWVYQTATKAWAAGLAMLRGVLLAVRMSAMLAGVAFNFLSLPVLLVVGAIALLGVGLYLLISHWDQVKAAITQTAAFQALADLVGKVAGVFGQAWQKIGQGWNWLVNTLSSVSPLGVLMGVAKSIGGLFGAAWDLVGQGWRGLVNTLGSLSPLGALMGVAKNIGGLFSAAWAQVVQGWDGLVNTLGGVSPLGALVSVAKKIGGLFGAAWESVGQGWNGLVNILASVSPLRALMGVAKSIGGLFSAAWARVGQGWNELVNTLGSVSPLGALMGVAKNIGELFSAAWARVVQGWNGLVNTLGSVSPLGALMDVAKNIGGLFSAAWARVVQGWSGLVNTLGSVSPLAALMGVAKSIGGLFGTAWEFIGQGWSRLVNALGSVSPLAALMSLAQWIGGAFGAAWALIGQGWNGLVNTLGSVSPLGALIGMAQAIGGAFSSAWEWVSQGWAGLVDNLGSLSPLAGMAAMAQSIGNVFSGLWQWLKTSFSGTYDWIVSKLNKIPGINIESKQNIEQSASFNGGLASQNKAGAFEPRALNNDLLTGNQLKGVSRGGLSKEISNNSKATTDNSKRIDTVNIYPPKGMTPTDLMEWQELN